MISVQTWQVEPTSTDVLEHAVHELAEHASQFAVHGEHKTPLSRYPVEQAEHVEASEHVEHPLEQA